MSVPIWCRILVLAIVAALLVPTASHAAVTAEQRKELTRLRRELGKVRALVRRDKTDEATKIVEEAEAWLDTAVAGGLAEDDKVVESFQKLIDSSRAALAGTKTPAKQKKTDHDEDQPQGPRFSADIAPLLQKNCLGCHADMASGGLRLDTFAGMKKGGRSGPLLTPGNPNASLIALRISTQNLLLRMPKNKPPLSAQEIQAIAIWIGQGAQFDGGDEQAMLGDLIKAAKEEKSDEQPGEKPTKSAPTPKVEVPKPTGKETVSFTRDIAPFMVNICLRCHSGDAPRGELSLETFEKLMVGGKSGQVVLPGDLEGSRLWDLAGKQQPIKMPPGDLLITPKNHSDLRTWIAEGAKFDGKDPGAPLRSIVPSAEDAKATELAAMSPEAFADLRLERSRQQWKQAIADEEPLVIEGAEIVALGNVPQSRLQQVAAWAEEQSTQLRRMFEDKSERLWPGRLAVFVFKDRFGYEEFNLEVDDRQAPRELIGHAAVAPPFEQAYVALEDVGDAAQADAPDMRTSLIQQLTAAFLQRSAATLPAWLVNGTGLALASQIDASSPYVKNLRRSVSKHLKTVQPPEQIFTDGALGPAAQDAVGLTLVEFLWKSKGPEAFRSFVTALQSGTETDAALQTAYGADSKQIATAYSSAHR